MILNKIAKITACLMSGVVISTMLISESAMAATTNPVLNKQRVSVHDPSIIKAPNGSYYVFGSHVEAAKSNDLQNWTRFTNGYSTSNNVLFDNLSANLKESFKWAGENDADCKGGFAVWAPSVIWNESYVNSDGSKGAYLMYYCTSSTYKRSAIGYAVSKHLEGPYKYVNTVIYSGFTKGDAHDSNSSINTNYKNTNIDDLINNKTISGINSKWFNNDGTYSTWYAPNAIDPELFYDKQGKLWMNYGSWSGGIYVLELDPATGMPKYPGKDANTSSKNLTDRYFGTRISGGYGESGEGAEIIYDKSSGYYYLYESYAGFASDGGYNMRMFRSKNPTGPFVDAAGNDAVLSKNGDNTYCGIKIMGNYKFSSQDTGYKSEGHNSAFVDDDGKMYLIYHTRFNTGNEYHEVRTHQMFLNEDKWPVTAPYEYTGDEISKNGYSKDEIVGKYEFINHGKSNDSKMLKTLNVNLNADNTVTGDISGTWSMKNNTYYMNLIYGGVTYKGVFFKQHDESKSGNTVMTFSAIGSNNECIWGSRSGKLDNASNNNGTNDNEVSKSDKTPIYKFDFEKSNGSKVVSNGSKSGNAVLKGSAKIVNDSKRGNVLTITNKAGASKANYLQLPSDTLKNVTKKGFTVGMWVNVDKKNANFVENSALFEASAGGQGKYPMTRLSANLFGRINSNGVWADMIEPSTQLKGNNWEYVAYRVDGNGVAVFLNGQEVGRIKTDLKSCFDNDMMKKLTDVRIGSGNIFGDPDIINARFDNISIYDRALTIEEIKNLYNEELGK